MVFCHLVVSIFYTTVLLDEFDDHFYPYFILIVVLYRIDQPTPRATEITYIINKVAIELTKAVPLLRHQRRLKEILPHCVEIHRLENEADDLRHAALTDLFDEETDVREILKWRDIYQNLESSVDKGEDVANVLEGIVLKYA